MTSQQFLVCDSSNLTNFKAWAKPISDFFLAAGWVQAADTGQVNWTSIGSVPGSGAWVYEIWKPGDALALFYVKIEYGNVSGANAPSMRLSLATSTNGAGTMTGFSFGPVNTNTDPATPPSTSTQYECNFSGTNNRMSVMMWRNSPSGNACQQFFSIERSVDASGAYTASYVTLWTGGKAPLNNSFSQRSLMFGVGAAPNSPTGVVASNTGGLVVRQLEVSGSGNTTVFNGSIPFDTCAPVVGYFDYACTTVGCAWGLDIAEGVTFTVTLYGATRTYMPSKVGPFATAGPRNSVGSILCMRYD